MEEKKVIKVIGVGGAGCNTVNRIIKESSHENISFVAADTDIWTLKNCQAGTKLNLMKARESDVRSILVGSDMVIITAGMGGKTGSLITSVIARVAKDMGILTIVLVTMPFRTEGAERIGNALSGVKQLKKQTEAIIVAYLKKLTDTAHKRITLKEAFEIADKKLCDRIMGVANLNFEDIETLLKENGDTFIGIGEGEGEAKADRALLQALFNLSCKIEDIQGASAAILQITSGPDLTQKDLENALSLFLNNTVNKNINFLFDHRVKEEIKNKASIVLLIKKNQGGKE